MKDSVHRADPVGPRGWHPAADEVSLCQDGVLEPRETAAIFAHIRSCPRCRQVQARLSDVRRILARQPDRNMPGGIATRIREALIIEATQSTGQWPPAPRSASLYS
jgi:anti-sigma factor RsiW